MATTINEQKTIELMDGTTFQARPLKISLLRDFMKTFEKVSEVAEDNDKSLNLLMECVVIALKQYKPELATDAKLLEDNIDLPTIYKIVEEASGINLSDSSLIGSAV